MGEGYVGRGGGVDTLGGGGVLWRGDTLRPGGGGGLFDVRIWSKMLFFWAHFGKLLHIGRPWMNLFVRVLQKVAEIIVIFTKFNQFSWILCTKNNPFY